MKIPTSLLRSVGLTDIEAQIYLAALELGEASMQDLSRKSGVKRTSIYNFIDKLIERQIIIETKKRKRSMYSAVSPDQLWEVGRTRLHELEKLLPELRAIHNQSMRKPRVTFYEGIDGIKEVYADTLQEKQPIVGWSDFQHMAEVLGRDYFSVYPPERAKRGITFQSIVCDTPIARELAKENSRVLRETKFITSGDLRTEINIYGDKVALMSFRSQPAFAVLIEDRDLAETLRVTWKELWKRI